MHVCHFNQIMHELSFVNAFLTPLMVYLYLNGTIRGGDN